MWALLHSKQLPRKNHQGFTIVELLIVIVVIAILAAITIVAYNGIQNRAKQSAAQTAASQANKKVLAFSIDNTDTYPEASGTNGIANLSALGINNSGDTSYQYSANNTTSPRTFCITATNGNQSYYISSTTQKPTSGACPGHGVGGVAAITNLLTNPGNQSSGTFTSYAGAGSTTTLSAPTVSWSQSGKSFRVLWNTVGTNPNEGDIGINFAPFITAGTTYTAVYKIAVNRASQVAAPALYASTGTYTTIDRSHDTIQTIAVNTRQTRWITFTANAAAISAGIRVVQSTQSKVANDWIEIGDAILVQGSTVVNYADGNSPGWVWNDTPGASSSTGPPL